MIASARKLEAIQPQIMLVGAVCYAMLGAHVEFSGRDRRRIKREVNKAARKAKRKLHAFKR